MSIENVTTALQAFATTGNGETLVLREPRLVTFKVRVEQTVATSLSVLQEENSGPRTITRSKSTVDLTALFA
jgi:hypothetical protein